jgi:hypothetical protein
MWLKVGDRVRAVHWGGSFYDVLSVEKDYFTIKAPGSDICRYSVLYQDNWEIEQMEKPKTLSEDLKLSTGRKDDGGKAPWGLLMQGCALGLAGVVSVLKFGAQKYAAHSWQKVENAEQRYVDAMYRHLHSIELRGFMAVDPESGLLEWFHVACNALFLATFAAMKAVAQAGRETH